MTKEEIQKVLDLAVEYYKLEIFGTNRVSQAPTQERIDWIYERLNHPLPSNLDEAAKKYEEEHTRYIQIPHSRTEVEYDVDIIDVFKAGAEWMANQGETRDDIVVTEDFDNKAHIFPIPSSEFNPGDRVIVQIRKK